MGAEFLFWKYRSVLSFIFLIVIVYRVNFASSFPVENGAPLAKMYPRGSHWAVGHLMGKKSIDFPLGYEEGDGTLYLSTGEEAKELDRPLKWSELIKIMIRALDGNNSQMGQLLEEDIPFSSKNAWEARDKSSNLKEVTNYLLQALTMKDNNPS
ncbi:gastrin-releasing peptide [Lepisosteus oculatus]|uniref:Gastrin-releasing peptide n=1 Tax=Lepisosteus oculatus TaxID=7918 RepID=W5N1Y3_LEPOC